MAPTARETLIRIYCETTGVGEADAKKRVDEIEHEHGCYVADIFAQSRNGLQRGGGWGPAEPGTW